MKKLFSALLVIIIAAIQLPALNPAALVRVFTNQLLN
jgi:hypothetical protein